MFEQHEQQNKEEVPQISEQTHVSYDYINALFSVEFFFTNYGIKGLAKALLEGECPLHIDTYTERFPENKYQNVINDLNSEQVAQIDQSAEDLNQILSDPIGLLEKEEKIRGLIAKIVTLVRGDS